MKEYLERGDPVQVSEKLYKAAEEALKILSRTYALTFMSRQRKVEDVEERLTLADKRGRE